MGCETPGFFSKEEPVVAAPAAPAPAAVDVAPQLSGFTLGPGDKIAISVWNNPELSQQVTVSPSGDVALSFLGHVTVTGKTARELTQLLTAEYERYYVEPVVALNVESSFSNKVTVLGEVLNPGVFAIDGQMRLIDGVAAASGYLPSAELKSVALLRKDGDKLEARLINLRDFLREGDFSQNPLLQKGDVVFVPSSFIAEVDDFFGHLYNIVHPIVETERGIALIPAVEDAFEGDQNRNNVIISR